MKIGVIKEIKNNENRVALTPPNVLNLVEQNHEIVVESNAGVGSFISNEEYEEVGAKIVDTAEAWSADLVLKVKEPLEEEYQYLRDDLVLFTYLHLAANKPLTEKLMETGTTAIAYEGVELDDRSFPLLSPMSEIAGEMAIQLSAHYLTHHQGGKGLLLYGAPGVKKGKVVIIGGGIVGESAARLALGLGASVTILDVNRQRLKQLEQIFDGRIETLQSNTFNIEEALKTADVAIGAVLLPGGKAPSLVSKEMVQAMEDGSVIVDIAIDQGGIFDTMNQATTHDDPVFEKEGVIHYAVANMPGAVPKTATYALANATTAYIRQLVNNPLEKILKENKPLQKGVNIYKGKLTKKTVASDLDLSYTPIGDCLGK